MEQYNIREYEIGDGLGISKLFTKFSPYLRDDKFWVWINRVWTKKSIVVVAEHDGEIVGHYAILPQYITIDNLEYKTGLGIHAFVSPEHKQSISIFQISTYAYNIARERGIDFIFGFPNRDYRLIQEKVERWKCVAKFNSYEIDATSFIPIVGNEFVVEDTDLSDFSRLYQLNSILEFQSPSIVSLDNSVSHWIKRYILHPQSPYVFFELKKQDQIYGYFVCKYYNKQNRKFFHIVDYAVFPNVNMKDALSAIFETQRNSTDIFSCWKGDSDFEQALLSIGFKDVGFDTFLGIKVLNREIEKNVVEQLLNFKNWRLVMGNSDAF